MLADGCYRCEWLPIREKPVWHNQTKLHTTIESWTPKDTEEWTFVVELEKCYSNNSTRGTADMLATSLLSEITLTNQFPTFWPSKSDPVTVHTSMVPHMQWGT